MIPKEKQQVVIFCGGKGVRMRELEELPVGCKAGKHRRIRILDAMCEDCGEKVKFDI